MCHRCVEARESKRAAKIRAKKENPGKLKLLRETFAYLVHLAELNRRDIDDLLLVAGKIRTHKDFVKQLASMTIDPEKHHHSKTSGF
ncbi:MAG: hypothetical protein Q7S83_02665 [bacterium]|nr:hypothetical protein [bacterium]